MPAQCEPELNAPETARHQTPTPTTRRIATWAPALLLCVAVIATFAPALRSGFINWDDDSNLTTNPNFRGFTLDHLRWMATTTLGGHYQPLTWLSFAANYAIGGMEPFGYHLTNLLLHAANAVLAFVLLQRLLRPLALAPEGVLRSAAFVGALFFAVHPLRVESVVWASERRDVLASLFWLVALLAYVGAAETCGRHRARRLAVALAALVLSLLAKAWGITFPVLLVILDAYPLRRFRRRLAPVLAEKVPFVLVAALAGVVAFVAQRSAGMSTLAHHGVMARIAQSAYGLCFYLVKTAWPVRLQPLYAIPPDFDPLQARYVAAMIAVAIMTGIALIGWRRWPWLGVTWASYVVILAPVLGLAQTGPQLVADRYTYLACLPATALLTAALARAMRALRAAGRSWITAPTAAALAILAVLAFDQSRVWHDSISFWSHVLRLDPNNVIAHNNRGSAQGVSESALADYSAAIRLDPTYYIAYVNRGAARDALGDKRGAMMDYAKAIDIAPDDPRAYNNRGWAREQLRDWPGALTDYTRARDRAAVDSPYRTLAEQNIAAVRAQIANAGAHDD